MATKTTKKRKGNVDTLDFTGVKAGGSTIPAGRYKAKIISAEMEEGRQSNEPYRSVTWEITSEKCNGREIRFDNYSLQPQALWRLKGLLEAMEVEVPDGEMDVDWDDLIDSETECIIEVMLEASQNDPAKKYARVVGHAPLSDGNTVDDEDGEEDPKPRRAGKKEEDEEERPRRRAKDEEEDADEDKPKRRGKAAKDEEEEDADEDEKPKGGKIKKGARVKFKDEKNKLTKGTIKSIDGDTAVVESDDEDQYEIGIDELTVI